MIKVALAEDHKIVRDGIKALLREESNIEVVGEVANGRELLELLPDREVDVILMDINMPEMDGFEATKQVVARYPSIKVLALSMLEHESYILKVLQAGAAGYILKNTGKEELVHAIQSVYTGHPYIYSEIALNLMKKHVSTDNEPIAESGKDEKHSTSKATGDLSKRELEVLRLIAEGLTNAEIAEKLFTSKRTIDGHRQSIIEKTHARNTAALIKYAVSKGIVS